MPKTVPDRPVDPVDTDVDDAGGVLADVTTFITKRTPIEISGAPGTSRAVAHVGDRYHGRLTLQPERGKERTRLADLEQLEAFARKLLSVTRVHLRAEIDLVEERAVEAGKIRVHDVEGVAS